MISRDPLEVAHQSQLPFLDQEALRFPHADCGPVFIDAETGMPCGERGAGCIEVEYLRDERQYRVIAPHGGVRLTEGEMTGDHRLSPGTELCVGNRRLLLPPFPLPEEPFVRLSMPRVNLGSPLVVANDRSGLFWGEGLYGEYACETDSGEGRRPLNRQAVLKVDTFQGRTVLVSLEGEKSFADPHIASELAARSIGRDCIKGCSIKDAMSSAGDALRDYLRRYERPYFFTMGAWAVGAEISVDRVTFANLGICRGLHISVDDFMTSRHTVADEQNLTPDEARNFRFSGVVTRAIRVEEGRPIDVDPSAETRLLYRGDWIVLGSTQLWRLLSKGEVKDCLLVCDNPKAAVEALRQLVKERVQVGAYDDNINLIVYRHLVGEPPPREPLPRPADSTVPGEGRVSSRPRGARMAPTGRPPEHHSAGEPQTREPGLLQRILGGLLRNRVVRGGGAQDDR